ncbi:MBL fold metallo-hydrolase [Kordiimonas lipolytica]|uniref:MBL fold metallo-hydrolase n=1 Tax=Kordiimonas lipolytica TaxID=1662421 RepID=A0ABV8UF83_9PROT|nr:MBL fold metallo-hydrolase [Kordiimonas lipolytica]
MTDAVLAVVAAVFLLSVSAFSTNAEPREQPEVRMLPGGTYILYGGADLGSSVGVVETQDGLVLIDTMEAGAADQLGQALRRLSKKPVSHIFNTHGHRDHSGGNDVFLRQGARLMDYQVLMASRDEVSGLGDALTLALGGVRIEIHAIAAHTSGDIVVFLPDQNVIFMGDTFTTNWHPTFYAGGETGQLAVIDKVLQLADEHTVIVPGHGRAGNRDSLLLYRSAFRRWMEKIRALSHKGASVHDMQADPELRQISVRFLQDGSTQALPECAYQRFVERTISTELMPTDREVLAHLEDYIGAYRYEDGIILRIERADGGVRVTEGGALSGLAVPLSKTRFHFRGRLEGEGHLTFQIDAEGKVSGVTYMDDAESWSAVRIHN